MKSAYSTASTSYSSGWATLSAGLTRARGARGFEGDQQLERTRASAVMNINDRPAKSLGRVRQDPGTVRLPHESRRPDPVLA